MPLPCKIPTKACWFAPKRICPDCENVEQLFKVMLQQAHATIGGLDNELERILRRNGGDFAIASQAHRLARRMTFSSKGINMTTFVPRIRGSDRFQSVEMPTSFVVVQDCIPLRPIKRMPKIAPPLLPIGSRAQTWPA